MKLRQTNDLLGRYESSVATESDKSKFPFQHYQNVYFKTSDCVTSGQPIQRN
jgi:hypothetical protein